MTITIELPEELAARAAAAGLGAEEVSRYAAAGAVAAVTTAAGQAETEQAAAPEPLRPFAEYPSKAAYVAEAVRRAAAFGVDPEEAAGIAAGIADVEAGRTVTLEEAQAELDAAFAARFGRART